MARSPSRRVPLAPDPPRVVPLPSSADRLQGSLLACRAPESIRRAGIANRLRVCVSVSVLRPGLGPRLWPERLCDLSADNMGAQSRDSTGCGSMLVPRAHVPRHDAAVSLWRAREPLRARWSQMFVCGHGRGLATDSGRAALLFAQRRAHRGRRASSGAARVHPYAMLPSHGAHIRA